MRVLFLLSAALLSGLMMILAGCGGSAHTPSTERESTPIDGGRYREWKHEGHVYLSASYGGLVHSESCPCKEKSR